MVKLGGRYIKTGIVWNKQNISLSEYNIKQSRKDITVTIGKFC